MMANAAPARGDTESPVLVRVDDHAIGWVTLNRPAVMNAITSEMAARLERAVLDTARMARVVVLHGAGGNFCAGGDFQEVTRLRDEGEAALGRLFEAFGRACSAVEQVDVPVVAAVEGNAMAGGFELAQACDIVLVADTARLSDNHVTHGALPGGGGSQRLPRIVGRARALAHMLSGEPLSAEVAVEWGLAYRALPTSSFQEGVESFAGSLAERSPDALAGIKHLVRRGLTMPLADGLHMERAAVVEHLLGAGADDIDHAARSTGRRAP